jgi:hypothetical protein
MPGLEWAFKLRDQVTQPAGSIESQLKRVAFALKSLDIATKQAQLGRITDPLKKTRLELQLHRDKLLLSKRAIDDHAKSSTNWRDSLVKWAASTYILRTIADGFREVGRAALDMGSQVKDAVETRQRGLFGLRATMGNRAGGNFFEQLERQAQAYGRPPGEVVAAGAGFQTAGASPDFARKLVGAVYDVRAATGGKSDITQQLQSILTSPVLDVGHLTGFGGALDLKKLWAAFGKRMGMRPGDAEQVLAHRIPGQFVAGGEGSPLLQAVFDQLGGMPGGQGGVGNIARGFAGGTLPGAIGRVQSAWEQFLASVDNSQGLKTLQNVLQNLARTLGGSSMRESLRGLADALGDALKPLTGPEGRQRMEEFFASLTELLKGTLPLLQKAAEWTDILVRYGTGQRAPGAPQSVGEEVSQIGSGIGALVGRLFSRNPTPQYLRSPYEQMSQPVIQVNVDARGGQRFDPEGFRRAIQHEIARQRQDAGPTEINDAFDQLGVQSGAQ